MNVKAHDMEDFMKKLFALLLTCSMIACTFSACGSEETSGESSDINSSSAVDSESEAVSGADTESKTSSESSTAEESSSAESSESKAEFEIIDKESDSSQAPLEITPGTASDENLIGAWTNDELSAAFSSIKFREDGIISTVVDCSSMMSISGEYLNMSGTDCPYEFDGTDFSCVITSADMGITDSDTEMEELSILEMTKLEPGDKSDVNGVYILNGGLLSDIYAEALPMDSDIYITVSNSSNIVMEVEVCGYDSDGKNITWKGDVETLLGIASGEEPVTPYKIEGDTLTISGSTDEVLTRNNDIYSTKVKTTTQPASTKKATTTKVTTKVIETQAKKETTEKATTTVEIVNEAEPTQLYLDFFEPYADSINQLTPSDFQQANADKLANYDVDFKEGNGQDIGSSMWHYIIKDNNGNEVRIYFCPTNIDDDVSEHINTLTTISYYNGDKEISVSDIFHSLSSSEIEYETYDANREIHNQNVSNVNELKEFILE